MIKSLLKLGVVLVIGVLAYNYFLGTPEEKASAREITGKIADIGKASFGLLKEEYQKFKDGKYDGAIDKIGNLLKDAKEKGSEYVEDIKAWEERRELWQEKKKQFEEMLDTESTDMSEEQMKKELEELEAEGKALEKEGKELEEKVGNN